MTRRNYILITLLFLSLTYSPDALGQDLEDDLKTLWDWFINQDNEHYYSYSNNTEDLDLQVNLRTNWLFSIGDNERWADPDHNDQSWETIRVPADWENEGFHGYDGHAWYRTHFEGKDLNPKHPQFLILGYIDDVDEVYFNGELIGRSGKFPPHFKTAYNAYRRYQIPGELINYNGDNVIAVRVYDDGLNGGIVNGEIGIYTHKYHQHLAQELYGKWKFITNDDPDYKDKYYKDDKWEDILVPSYWDQQGYKLFDGVAWYRKSFKLNFNFKPNEKYYLVLGKIDDFDQTYLNGEKIGETDDGKRTGDSRSYNQLRIYKIPSGSLSKNSSNVISVRVKDIGYDGGIYEGPIGIIEESNLNNLYKR
ncbi:MAG: beta galactosidase jelly roll domain-containing protein [Reichenbachiella sp.]